MKKSIIGDICICPLSGTSNIDARTAMLNQQIIQSFVDTAQEIWSTNMLINSISFETLKVKLEAIVRASGKGGF